MAVHQEQTVYRNRAEERRKAVGSTAFTRPRRPAPQPLLQPSGYQTAASEPQETPIPGKVQIETSGPTAIGKMLLQKDGWLEKHEEKSSSTLSNASVNRGGLGYQESKKSMYNSMILEGDFFMKK